MNSDPPWCKYVNEDTECEDSLAKEMCIKACRKLEGNYFDTFICKFYKCMKHLNSSVKSQLSFVFLGTHSESSDTGHPSMGADELNQETAYAKINIEEHVGQAMVIQQFLEKFDATGKIVALSLT